MTLDKRALRADDLYDIEIASDPQISPDGTQIVFSLQRIDRGSEKKYINLWLVPFEGGEPQQFTFGDQVDRYPRWSPDGKQIAFLSNRNDSEQEQLFLIRAGGGEAKCLTDLVGAWSDFEWSPNGQKIVFQFRRKDAEEVARDNNDQLKKLGQVVRQITNLDYKLDGSGYHPQERWHIWTIEMAHGQTVQLTDGRFDESGPRWSPDSDQILFISNRSKDPSQEPEAIDLYLIPATGGEFKQIKTRFGRKSLATFSPDGQSIAFISNVETGAYFQNDVLYVVPTSGGEARDISSSSDLHLALCTLTDTGSGAKQSPPVWSLEGDRVIVQAASHGNQHLLSFSLDGDCTPIIDEPGVVGAFSMDAAQKGLVTLWGQIDRTGQVRAHDLVRGRSTSLTNFNARLFREVHWGELEEVHFQGSDGQDLHGWILKPPNFDPDKQYASILEIHGGPFMQYGNLFMHEFHYLAAQEYVVYWSNPRGSQGYGQDFAGAIFDKWGTVDYEDVIAWADYMEQQPYIDAKRMGITGGSYGGFMTTTVIGRTHRFSAAVAQRVVSNWLSFYGSSDMNWLTEYLVGTPGPPWENFEAYWQQSPMSTISQAKTPTMIIHSERDFRCDREQGEQVFVALQRQGVDSELLLFPEESHSLSRSGRTDRRVARLTHMARWFEKYLK